ncbi:MAG TPA: ParA family protein [Clostridiales bacterium]|nr:ParA family protein [Clostridiales bacterium]
MAKIISVINQKGGVGKTTTAVNLSACLGILDKKVLLLDIDPQGNSTSGYGINKRDNEYTSYDLFVNGADIHDCIKETKFKNVSIVSSNINLTGVEIEILDIPQRERILKNAILPVLDEYDFIFLDCPPSLGLISLNALTASDTFLVPIQAEYYALEGLSQLMSTVRKIKIKYNQYIDIEGVLLTMFDGRLTHSRQVTEEIKKFFPKKVYATVIPRNVRLSEAPSYGEPIVYYDKRSSGAESYMNLAKEFLRKQ